MYRQQSGPCEMSAIGLVQLSGQLVRRRELELTAAGHELSRAVERHGPDLVVPQRVGTGGPVLDPDGIVETLADGLHGPDAITKRGVPGLVVRITGGTEHLRIAVTIGVDG